jgi:hypothetical protein
MPDEKATVKKAGMGLVFVLCAVLVLVACGATFEVHVEEGPPQQTATVGAGDATQQVPMTRSPTAAMSPAVPTVPESERLKPTVTPTGRSGTRPAETPLPTATSTPVPTIASVTPPAGPEILSFQAIPMEADPGETVTLTWQAKGDRAMICPTARYVLFTRDDCQSVATSGELTFTIPPETDGFQTVEFLLEVERLASDATLTAQTSVSLKCDRTWFFSDAPQAGICPREPIRSYAAAQHFERGLMIWMEEPGWYYILEEERQQGTDRNRVDIIEDPLQVVRETSQEVEAPPGFHAPMSGFGLVWRGDVEGSPGYRQRLGWALEPEFGYEATLQCDDARPSGGRSWQTCVLQGPDGEVIVLHPLGGWELRSER